jgi:hypothetical protein
MMIYSDIQCIVVPAVEKNFPKSDRILHHEHASSQIARRVMEVIEELKIHMLQWSWNFLDLNLGYGDRCGKWTVRPMNG